MSLSKNFPLYILPLLCFALVTTGCSLRYDFTECTSDADCMGVEGDGTFYTCQSNQCIVTTDVQCRTNQDCTTAPNTKCEANKCVNPNPQGDMSKMPDMSDMSDMNEGCTTNTQCIDSKGAGFLCGGDGQCFSALSEDCTELHMPKNENDNIVVVTSLLPLIEPFGSSIGTPLANAVEFAQTQFNGEGGLPGGRKIAWLSCDTKGNTQIAKRAATHASSVVKSPAFIGPLFSENYIAVASDIAKPNNIAIFAPTATSPAVTSLHTKPDDMVWRNIPSDIFQGDAFLKRIAQLGVPKVMVLYKDDKYGEDLQAQISPGLINTLSASNVRVAKYDNPVTIPDAQERRNKYGMILQQQLMNFEPQAILVLGTSEGAEVAGAYLTVASALSQAPGKIIFSHGVVAVMTQFAQSLPAPVIDNNLVEAIAPSIFDPKDQSYKSFSLNYNLTFGQTANSLVATTTFDAAMTIFFAMSTIDAGADITGTKIAAGMSRLNDKENGTEIKFFVTPSYAGKGRQELEAGRNIDMVGVSGQLDYDPATGDVYNQFYGWEIVRNNANGFEIKNRRVLPYTNPPATTGEWQNIPQ